MPTKTKPEKLNWIVTNEDVRVVLYRHGLAYSTVNYAVLAAVAMLRPFRARIAKAVGNYGSEKEREENGLAEIEAILIKKKVLVEPTLFDEDGRRRWEMIEQGTEKDQIISKACKALADALDDDLILKFHNKDAAHRVYLCVYSPKGSNVVEFAVSDGPPGDRSDARSFYAFGEALKEYNWIIKHGWCKQRPGS